MSEHTLPTSEEPPSPSSLDTYRQYRKPLESAEGLAVTDPRDPFVWLYRQAILNMSSTPISSRGKNMLWFTYRINGNYPETEHHEKWRDKELTAEDLALELTDYDKKYVEEYQKHLTQIGMNEVAENTELTNEIIRKERERRVVREAEKLLAEEAESIWEHYRIIAESALYNHRSQ